MIVGISMVRDEADVIDQTMINLRIQGVDRFIVLDNGSTDKTRRLLDCSDIEVVDDPEVGYHQDQKMARLARMAYERGATWVVPFDADEYWYSPTGTIAETLAGITDNVVAAREFKHWPTPWDEPVDDPFKRLRFRETEPHRLHKIVFRAVSDPKVHMGNHGINYGDYDPDRPDPALLALELRHFPYRSFSQFARKVRNGREAYEAADMHPMFGTHWREMGAYTEEQLREVWADCTAGTSFEHRWLGHGELIEDPAP